MNNITLLSIMQQVWLRAGLNLLNHTKLFNVTVVFLFIIMSTLAIFAVLVPILEETNLTTIADAFQIASPIAQIVIKLVAVTFSMNKIRIMLHKIEDLFWTKDKLGVNVESELLAVDKIVNVVFKIAIRVVYVFAAILLFRPLLSINGSREYPLLTYNIVDINDNKMYAMMYIYQTVVFILGPNVLLAVDGLYLLFLTNLYIQLTMLKYAFSELRIDQIEKDADEEMVYLKLKEYIDHHNVILSLPLWFVAVGLVYIFFFKALHRLRLAIVNYVKWKSMVEAVCFLSFAARFIKDFGELYSFQVLCQFLGNTLSLCMGLFIFYGGESDIFSLIRTFFIISVFIVELVFFCAGGTLITDLCQDIAPIVFYNGWERMYSKRIRFAIFMIIMSSNKPEIIKAGKMFYVNLTTIGQILKAAASTFTLMTNVSARKGK